MKSSQRSGFPFSISWSLLLGSCGQWGTLPRILESSSAESAASMAVEVARSGSLFIRRSSARRTRSSCRSGPHPFTFHGDDGELVADNPEVFSLAQFHEATLFFFSRFSRTFFERITDASGSISPPHALKDQLAQVIDFTLLESCHRVRKTHVHLSKRHMLRTSRQYRQMPPLGF